jgi:hypothetical protein
MNEAISFMIPRPMPEFLEPIAISSQTWRRTWFAPSEDHHRRDGFKEARQDFIKKNGVSTSVTQQTYNPQIIRDAILNGPYQ